MPCFSVIIATCDRPDELAKALEAVGRAMAAAGGRHELIVVDNGALRSAEAVSRRVGEHAGLSVGYLRSNPRNKARALNVGVSAARNEWLGFTDDDAVPAEEWLKQAGRYAESAGVRCFGGKVEPGPAAGPLPAWLKPGRSGRVPRGPAIVEYAPLASSGVLDGRMQVPLGANVFVRKAVFERHGGYDEALWMRCGAAALGSEDAEWAMRVRRGGDQIGYCAEAVVAHPVYRDRATVRNHLRWAYRAGVREAILFPEETARLSRGYLARQAAAEMVNAVRCGVGGDGAGAVAALMNVAQCWGLLRQDSVSEKGKAELNTKDTKDTKQEKDLSEL